MKIPKILVLGFFAGFLPFTIFAEGILTTSSFIVDCSRDDWNSGACDKAMPKPGYYGCKYGAKRIGNWQRYISSTCTIEGPVDPSTGQPTCLQMDNFDYYETLAQCLAPPASEN